MRDTICIEKISMYSQTIVNDTLILKLIEKYVTREELKFIDLSSSKVVWCEIFHHENTISLGRRFFIQILIDVWKNTPVQQILQNTIFNFKLTEERGEKGYNWNDDINMSYQSKKTNDTMCEIINMCVLNGFSLNIKIILKNNDTIILNI